MTKSLIVSNVSGEIGEVYATEFGTVTVDEETISDTVTGYPPVGTTGWRQEDENTRVAVEIAQYGHSFRYWRKL